MCLLVDHDLGQGRVGGLIGPLRWEEKEEEEKEEEENKEEEEEENAKNIKIKMRR
jgi:hypothetical protein